MMQELACPACRKPVAVTTQTVFACPHCRQELRVNGKALEVVVDPDDDRRRPNVSGHNPNVFRNL